MCSRCGRGIWDGIYDRSCLCAALLCGKCWRRDPRCARCVDDPRRTTILKGGFDDEEVTPTIDEDAWKKRFG